MGNPTDEGKPVTGAAGGSAAPGGSATLLRTAFGAVMRRIRREQGRTLADVAQEADVSLPYLSELERGQKEASSEILAAICEALGIELPELLAEAGRDLVAARERRATVVGVTVLAERRRRTGATAQPGRGDVRCALAA